MKKIFILLIVITCFTNINAISSYENDKLVDLEIRKKLIKEEEKNREESLEVEEIDVYPTSDRYLDEKIGVAINFGYNSDNELPSMGVEMFYYGDYTAYGIGFYVAGFSSGTKPENDYEIPHYNYVYDEPYVSSEYGIYLSWGLSLLNNRLNLLGKVGYSYIERSEVIRSLSTGWTYKGESEYEIFGMYGVELSLKLDYVILGVEFNNRRGVVGIIGFQI